MWLTCKRGTDLQKNEFDSGIIILIIIRMWNIERVKPGQAHCCLPHVVFTYLWSRTRSVSQHEWPLVIEYICRRLTIRLAARMRRIVFFSLIFKQCYTVVDSSWVLNGRTRNVTCGWPNKRNGCTKFVVFVVQLSSSSIIFLPVPSCTWGVCAYWISKGITDQNCGCCQWDACKSYGHFSNLTGTNCICLTSIFLQKRVVLSIFIVFC